MVSSSAASTTSAITKTVVPPCTSSSRVHRASSVPEAANAEYEYLDVPRRPPTVTMLLFAVIGLVLVGTTTAEVFTNTFLVRMRQPAERHVADRVAFRNGFVNLGPVSPTESASGGPRPLNESREGTRQVIRERYPEYRRSRHARHSSRIHSSYMYFLFFPFRSVFLSSFRFFLRR